MKINSITRLIIMSAMTCVSTAALADVTPHSNTDSVDFAANMTVQGKQCPLTVTKTGDVGFTYTYTQEDAATGAQGTMTVDSPDASVTVSTSEGCQLHTLLITTPSRTGLIKVAKNTAALPTRNGGFIPFVAQLANVTFSDGTKTTGGFTTFPSTGSIVVTVADAAPAAPLTFGGTNEDTKLAGVNVPGISGLTGGHLRYNGTVTNVSAADGGSSIRNGMLDMKGLNDNPTGPFTDTDFWLTKWTPSNAGGTEADPNFHATSSTFTFTAMVGTTVYSLANKSPDPDAVYDGESLSTTATYTFTAI